MPETTKDRVRDLDSKGLTVRQIAGLLGISTQRVYVLLKKIRAEEQAEAVA